MASEDSRASRLRRFLIGAARSPQDPHVFHRLSLIAFFAWVGLGADGLSSSCYGPAEAFSALGEHAYLGIFVAIGSALTIFIISASYSQIIELFPSGGGGYLVASKLLSPTLGMISGCALLIDYMLTIALSIASGAEAIFSFLPAGWLPFRLEFAILGVIAITILNLRGVKESVLALLPIFLLFIGTHLFAISYALIAHSGNLPEVAGSTVQQVHSVTSQVGLFGLLAIIMRAYSMGAGTFTGIEAVSNGLSILREPRVETGRRTMKYMAISLAVMVLGLMLAYMLYRVTMVPGKTLNAVLLEQVTADWTPSLSRLFVWVTLLTEGAILFVAAQAGFLDGPRVLANMALDRWFATRFASLSDRLVTQNGILLMGLSALILMIVTRGSVQILIILYSINVFITFVLSQAGMVRHWWQVRTSEIRWKRKLSLSGLGLILCGFILISVTVIKFHEGGWVTLLITGALAAIMLGIRRHYRKTFQLLTRLNSLVEAADISPGQPADPAPYDPNAMTAVVLVNGYNGLGLHTLFGIFRLFKGSFRNFVFVQVGVVDAGVFKGKVEIEKLKEHVAGDLQRYVEFVKREGYYAEAMHSIGVDVVDEIETACKPIRGKYPQAIFFGGQIVFPEETFLTRWLHNYVVFAAQRRFYHQGIPFIILPIRV